MSMKMDRRLILAGLYGPMVFALVILLLGTMYPGYDHVRNVISDLGSEGAPTELLMNVFGFALFGAFMIMFALGVYAIRGRSFIGKLEAALFAAGGISFALISINTNPIHMLATISVFFFLFPAFILMAIDTAKERSMKYYFIVAAGLGLATLYCGFLWLGVDSYEESLTSGLKQRASMSSWLLLMMYTSWKLYKLKSK